MGTHVTELTNELVQAFSRRNGELEVEVRVGYIHQDREERDRRQRELDEQDNFKPSVALPHFQRLIDTFENLNVPFVTTDIVSHSYQMVKGDPRKVRYRTTNGVSAWEIKESVWTKDDDNNSIRLAISQERRITPETTLELISNIKKLSHLTREPERTMKSASALSDEQYLVLHPTIFTDLITLLTNVKPLPTDAINGISDIYRLLYRGDVTHIRQIERRSYLLGADLLRVDMSKVTVGSKVTREVEIEFVDPTNNNGIDLTLLKQGVAAAVTTYVNGCDKVLRYLWGTDILYTSEEKTRVNLLVSKVLGEKTPRGDKIDRNLLTEARNLKISDLRIGGMIGGKWAMSCTRKVDGGRRVLLLGPLGVWLVWPPFEYNKISNEKYKKITLFDGEVVLKGVKKPQAPDTKYWYKIIDFMWENGPITWKDEPDLILRQEKAQQVSDDLDKGGYYPPTLTVDTKSFEGFKCSPDKFFEVTTEMLDKHTVDYEIDGLVFTPVNYPYLIKPDLSLILQAVNTNNKIRLHATGDKDNSVLFTGTSQFPFNYDKMLDTTNISMGVGDYRWDYGDKRLHLSRILKGKKKPATIGAAIGVWRAINNPMANHVALSDRKLSRHPDICKWKFPERLSIDFLAVDTGEGIRLYSGSSEKKGQRDLFVGTSRFPFDYSTMLIPTHPPLKDNESIIEYQWDYTNKWLYPFKPRPEKSGPNRTEVVADNWDSINQPITKDDITGVSLGLMFRYHGDISWKLHGGVSGEYLLDFGSGRGGQAAKWKEGKYKRVIAIEPEKKYLIELRKRIAGLGIEDMVYVYEGSGQDTEQITEVVRRETNGAMVDVITAINSLTFFWESIPLLTRLCATINNCARPDCKFVWMMLDGERVRQMLEPALGGDTTNQLVFGNATITAERSDNNKLTGKVVVDFGTELVGKITEWLTRTSDLGQLLINCDWSDYHVADANGFMPKHARILSSLYSYGTWTINVSQEKGMANPPLRFTPPPNRGSLPPSSLPPSSIRGGPPTSLPSGRGTSSTAPSPAPLSSIRGGPPTSLAGSRGTAAPSPSRGSTVSPAPLSSLRGGTPLGALRNVPSPSPSLRVDAKSLSILIGENRLEQLSEFARVSGGSVVRWYTTPNKEVVRISTIADGTCFVHAVLSCIDPIYKVSGTPKRQQLADNVRLEAANNLLLVNPTTNTIGWETANKGSFPETYGQQIGAIISNKQLVEDYRKAEANYATTIGLLNKMDPNSSAIGDIRAQAYDNYAEMIRLNLSPDQLIDFSFATLTSEQKVDKYRDYGQRTPFDSGFEIGNKQDFSVPGLWSLFNSRYCLGDEAIAYLSDLLGYDIYIIGATDQYIYTKTHTVHQGTKRPSIVILNVSGHYEAVGERDMNTGVVQTVFRPGDQNTQDTMLTSIRRLFFPGDIYNDNPPEGRDANPLNLPSLYRIILDRWLTPPPNRSVPDLVYRALEKTKSDGRGNGFPSPLFDYLWANEDNMKNGVLLPGQQISNTPRNYYYNQTMRAIEDAYQANPTKEGKIDAIDKIIITNALFIGKKGYGHTAEMNYEKWSTWVSPIRERARTPDGTVDINWLLETLKVSHGDLVREGRIQEASVVEQEYAVVFDFNELITGAASGSISRIRDDVDQLAQGMREEAVRRHPDLA